MTIYSDNLRLALQEFAENDDTWGDIANEGVFKLLESAIAGRQDIGLGANDATLTQLNGQADTSRPMILNLTGTLAVPRTVNTPAVSKLYLIWNNTVGGQPINIVPAGGTGLQITETGAFWVFIDGLAPPTARRVDPGAASTADFADDAGSLGGIDAAFYARKDQGTAEGQVFTRAQRVSRGTLVASGGLVAVDAGVSNCFVLTMQGDYTLSNPTNGGDGQTVRIIIKQDAAGNRLLGFGAKYRFPGGTPPTLSTAANARDYLGMEYFSTDDVWIANLIKGV
jgi:hypothetical protein